MIQQTKHDPKKIVVAAVVSGSMARQASINDWWVSGGSGRDERDFEIAWMAPDVFAFSNHWCGLIPVEDRGPGGARAPDLAYILRYNRTLHL